MEIAAWLRGLSLERYAEAFRNNAIELEVLPGPSCSDTNTRDFYSLSRFELLWFTEKNTCLRRHSKPILLDFLLSRFPPGYVPVT